MSNSLKLLDVVALLEDLPDYRLRRGQVGTVVEILTPDVNEVEFVDEAGQTYAQVPLRAEQLLGLHYHLIEAQ